MAIVPYSAGGMGALLPLPGPFAQPSAQQPQARDWDAEEAKIRNKMMLAQIMSQQAPPSNNVVGGLSKLLRGYVTGKAYGEGMRGEEKLTADRKAYERSVLADLAKSTGKEGYAALAGLSPEMQTLAAAILKPNLQSFSGTDTVVDADTGRVVREGSGKPPTQRKRQIDDWTTQQEEFVNGEWVPVGPPTQSSSRFKQVVTVDENGNAQIGYVDLSTVGPGRGGASGEPSVVNVGERPGASTGTQRASKAYLSRMRASEAELRKFSGANPDFNPSSVVEGIRGVTNITATPQWRQYTNLASDWIRAKLRKESGAAIGVQEMEEEFKLYFPQPGDDPGTIAQKAQRRKQAEIQLEIEGGIRKPEESVEPEQPPESQPIKLPPGVTAEDIMVTAEENGMTPEQVVEELWRRRGGA